MPENPSPTPQERVSRLASTVGRFTRGGRTRLGGLPGVSATADVIAARHCVDLLAARLKEDPTDPRRHVWLAEALIRTRRDLRAVSHARTVAEPTSLLVRVAVRRAAALGVDGAIEPAELRLLRRGFRLAQARVRAGHADAGALHVLARVYLARNMPAEALRLMGVALRLQSDEHGDLFVTAARALHQLQRREDAERAAERAVEHGSTLGYEVLARLRATDRTDLIRDPSAGVSGWLEFRRGVRVEDRARYCGAARTSREVARAVGTSQWRKAGTTLGEALELASRAQRASKELTS